MAEITVTAKVTYTYDTDEGLVTDVDAALDDVRSMLDSGDLSSQDYEFQTEVQGTLPDPDDDDLAWAREDLGADAPEDQVRQVAERRAGERAAEDRRQVCVYCHLPVHVGGEGLLVDERTGDWWCRANPSNGGDAAPHEVQS